MNVSLTAELEKLVESKVSSGRYKSASEVIREGLRLLEERDELITLKRETIRAQIAEGVEQAENGLLSDGDEAMARVKERIEGRKKGAK